MNTWFRFLTLLVLLFPVSVNAADRGPIGVGVLLGDPLGISIKHMTDTANAVNLGAAVDMDNTGDFHLHIDYQRHFYPWDENGWKEGKLALVAGLGVRLRLLEDEDDDAGIRIPFGATLKLASLPVDVFAEAVPVVVAVPDVGLDFDWGVGARFWF